MVAPRTLLALLALLFSATQCVDIDDRDLEVSDGDDDGTGGGASICEPDSDDNDCSLCTKDVCCDETVDCAESTECQYFVYCWEPCVDDVCVNDCIDFYPEGAELFDAWLTCTYDNCFEVCS